ncbi:MAG: hypothetical protein IJE16_07270 [Ruminococcus sp.]|nr:hypothetical protein [Ruminococcus sp.]
MDDLSSKISEILSDPQALEQIKGLGEILGMNNTSNTPIHKEESNKSDSVLSSLSSGFSPQMLSMMTKLAPLLSDMNKEDDTTRLLFALRPFLSDERKKKLDEASKILKIMKLLPLVKDVGILDSLF